MHADNGLLASEAKVWDRKAPRLYHSIIYTDRMLWLYLYNVLQLFLIYLATILGYVWASAMP